MKDNSTDLVCFFSAVMAFVSFMADAYVIAALLVMVLVLESRDRLDND